jgi:hypothetical protein
MRDGHGAAVSPPAREARNPKHEIRNNPEAPKRKCQKDVLPEAEAAFRRFFFLGSEFVSGFVLRASDFTP